MRTHRAPTAAPVLLASFWQQMASIVKVLTALTSDPWPLTPCTWLSLEQTASGSYCEHREFVSNMAQGNHESSGAVREQGSHGSHE